MRKSKKQTLEEQAATGAVRAAASCSELTKTPRQTGEPVCPGRVKLKRNGRAASTE